MVANAVPVRIALLSAVLLIAACSAPPKRAGKTTAPPGISRIIVDSAQRQEVLLYALGLLDVGYQFGGKNPEAGLDCSGMVSFIYRNAAGVSLPHNAAQIAQIARPIDRRQLDAGDLVFFNTLGRPYSHVGVYIGDGKFVHAPSSGGKIKVESLDKPYFAQRFEGGRSLFAGP
ncbi:C40 family peptidase [Chitiniphilus purpureus]|uniref:C40 family peptidase n=1 Tax=Chitiniphilus purpureus TaxID=2981137 RepID=A0ABY6DRX6_9NEIS|nr:C40 family peptidase [Chitiniphilus sp. CD1]UXY17077.1 C40 family peptidase [Chitiniphilus sp. CD1]